VDMLLARRFEHVGPGRSPGAAQGKAGFGLQQFQRAPYLEVVIQFSAFFEGQPALPRPGRQFIDTFHIGWRQAYSPVRSIEYTWSTKEGLYQLFALFDGFKIALHSLF